MSANALNLDWSKIVSFGNGLRKINAEKADNKPLILFLQYFQLSTSSELF